MSDIYSNINSQLHTNQNLSLYARHQKEARIEHSKLTPEEQKEKLLQVYNNRPPVFSDEAKVPPKQITATQGSQRQKLQMGIINPIHQFEDPRIIKNEAKQKEQEWYAQRMKQKQRPKPEDPLLEPQPDLVLQANKIQLKPPPMLEKEKPLMQDHLANPYIYIKKIFKKNSVESQMKHPDIWDKSTHVESLRINKVMKQEGKKRPQSAKVIQQQQIPQQDKQKEKLNKKEREEFYLKNLKMKEFLFKFFKTINHLLKARKYNKIIYKGDQQNYDLNTLFNLWADHKKFNFKSNPEKFITKEQFVDFLLLIGLDPDRSHEAERFFDYCHEDVVKAPGITQQEQNTQAQQDSKWFRLFKD
ncbi:unnamed protein product [Paramecium primaurelia]|uniref:Uncharacterized protein n=1 Tax=Paramecium primaurelia TaxID=5886 RepID=A0A8S1LD55_PARPR|nr:unnamed protein product [Paramecium primaurelia]